MMNSQEILQRMQDNSKVLANKGSQLFEQAYTRSLDTLHQARLDGPEFISDLFRKGEVELKDAIERTQSFYHTHLDRITHLPQDTISALSQIREKYFKDLPPQGIDYQNIIDKVSEQLSDLSTKFFPASQHIIKKQDADSTETPIN